MEASRLIVLSLADFVRRTSGAISGALRCKDGSGPVNRLIQ
jgi:hypothetical protein